MIEMALNYAFICFGIGLVLNLAVLIRGPNASDRLLALDTMVVNVIALLVLYSIRLHATQIFEVTMLLAMTGFVSTVAFCKYLLRGSLIE